MTQPSTPQTPDAVVAEVGGRKITMKELDDRWQSMDPAERARVTQLLYQNRRNVLDQMMGDVLIEQAAKTAGVAGREVHRRRDGETAEASYRRRSPAVLRGQQGPRAGPSVRTAQRTRFEAFLTSNRQQQARAVLVDDLKKKAGAAARHARPAANRRSRSRTTIRRSVRQPRR